MFGDKEFDGVGYPTPSSIPLENSWRTAKIPADAAWQGIFMGVLETLLDEKNWQQFEGGISREDAAAVWLEIIEGLYVSAEEGPCCPEFSIDPGTGLPQVSYDDGLTFSPFPAGPWVDDPPGPYAAPPPPLNKGSDAADICQASANAAAVLAEFYAQTFGAFTAGAFNAVLAINSFLSRLNRDLLNLVYPEVPQLEQALGWDDFDFETQFTASSLDSDQMTALTCLLVAEASIADGVVTFNYDNVYAGLTDALGLNPGTAVTLLLLYIDEAGLNRAGGVNSVVDPDCSDCTVNWCYIIDDFSSWTITRGTLVSGTVVSVNVPGTGQAVELSTLVTLDTGTTITKLTATYQRSTGGPVVTDLQAAPGIDSGFVSGSEGAGNFERVATGETEDDNPGLYVYGDTGSSAILTLLTLKVEGVGVNPFGDDNC